MKLIIRYKGGAGSGNFGHAGRKGKVGGSRSIDGIAVGKLYSAEELDKENEISTEKFLHIGKASYSLSSVGVTLSRMKLSDVEIEHYFPKRVNNGKVHLSYELKVHPDKISSRTAYDFMRGILTVQDVAEQLGVVF